MRLAKATLEYTWLPWMIFDNTFSSFDVVFLLINPLRSSDCVPLDGKIYLNRDSGPFENSKQVGKNVNTSKTDSDVENGVSEYGCDGVPERRWESRPW